jgi:hypothetical protein
MQKKMKSGQKVVKNLLHFSKRPISKAFSMDKNGQKSKQIVNT